MTKADIIRKLKTLKNMLETSDDLPATWAYFDKHLGLNEPFFELGRPGQDPDLVFAFKMVASMAFQEKAKELVLVPKTVKYKEYQFVHGMCEMCKCMCAAFYFSDIRKGLCYLNLMGFVFFSLFTLEKTGKEYDFEMMEDLPPISLN